MPQTKKAPSSRGNGAEGETTNNPIEKEKKMFGPQDSDTLAPMQALLREQAPVVNHWMSKARIMQGLVSGDQQGALCGERVAVGSRGGGSVAAAGASVCPLCQLAYNALEPVGGVS